MWEEFDYVNAGIMDGSQDINRAEVVHVGGVPVTSVDVPQGDAIRYLWVTIFEIVDFSDWVDKATIGVTGDAVLVWITK